MFKYFIFFFLTLSSKNIFAYDCLNKGFYSLGYNNRSNKISLKNNTILSENSRGIIAEYYRLCPVEDIEEIYSINYQTIRYETRNHTNLLNLKAKIKQKYKKGINNNAFVSLNDQFILYEKNNIINEDKFLELNVGQGLDFTWFRNNKHHFEGGLKIGFGLNNSNNLSSYQYRYGFGTRYLYKIYKKGSIQLIINYEKERYRHSFNRIYLESINLNFKYLFRF